MTGRPQRARPKSSVQLEIDADAYQRLRLLYENEACSFKSLSGLVEAIMFLMESEYVENRRDDLVSKLSVHEERRFEHTVDLQAPPDQHKLHLTLDRHAKEFLDMLVKKYRVLFRNRNALVSDMLYLVAERCDDPRKTAWVLRRLEDARDNHPLQAKNA